MALRTGWLYSFNTMQNENLFCTLVFTRVHHEHVRDFVTTRLTSSGDSDPVRDDADKICLQTLEELCKDSIQLNANIKFFCKLGYW